MFRSIYRTSVPVLVLLIFGLQVIFLSPESYSQGLLKTANVPGGGGSSSGQTEDTGGGSSALLIVGGVIIAGLLFYKLVIDKDESKKEEKKDSTSQGSLLIRSPESLLPVEMPNRAQMMPDIPLNIYLGFQNSDPVLREKKFIMGISCKF